MQVYFFVALGALLSSHALAFNAWKLSSLVEQRPANENDGESIILEQTLTVDFKGLSDFFTTSRNAKQRGETREETMTFDLPQFGVQTCTLHASNLFPPGLAARNPSIILRTGSCNHGSITMLLNMVTDEPSSFSATFTIPGAYMDWFYVDFKQDTEYRIYAKSSKTANENRPARTCSELHREDEEEPEQKQDAHERRRLYSGPFVGSTLRLAVVANREYSIFSGDSVALTLNAIAAVISRVNGIYMRELSTYLQLAEDNDLLICANGLTTDCDTLPNDDGGTIIDNAKTFITSRGVSYSSYDLGHVFSTGSGGLAYLGVLCHGTLKAGGTTGMDNPVGDAFSVDYVAHELGHQLNGGHSFRHCTWDGNESPSTASEPGSGSTIMGYGGICGANNLQTKSDPYFSVINLPMMTDHINTKVTTVSQCGTRINFPDVVRPAIVSPNSGFTCNIPVGNYFMLQGTASGASYFQWDQSDVGLQSFTDLTIPRFRSWKPRTVNMRFFPNLYYLTFNVQNSDPYRKYEILPSAPTTMKFRFLARSLYDTNAIGNAQDANVLGDFAFRDSFVQFVDTTAALKFSAPTRALLSGTVSSGNTVSFTWNAGGGGTAQVEIMVAVNTMTLVNVNTFNSEVHLKDLNWMSLLVTNNNGSATLNVMPNVGTGNNQEVNFMIRTSALNCAAFDFVARGKVDNSVILPSNAPTSLPSALVVTNRPTRLPTLRPSTEAPNGVEVTEAPTGVEASETLSPTSAAQNLKGSSFFMVFLLLLLGVM